MDVYMPHVPEHASSRGHGPHLIDNSAVRHCPNSPAGYPVALFCHGGVWATGIQISSLCSHAMSAMPSTPSVAGMLVQPAKEGCMKGPGDLQSTFLRREPGAA